MKASEESVNTPGAEEFCPDADCSTDEAIGGDRGQCALVEECTLRCHIRFLDGEMQPNDSFVRP